MSEILAKSKVMENFQTVIPAAIRSAAGVGIGDSVIWMKENGTIDVAIEKKPSLRNIISLGTAVKCTDAVALKKEAQR